jgi:hypothetical protein
MSGQLKVETRPTMLPGIDAIQRYGRSELFYKVT